MTSGELAEKAGSSEKTIRTDIAMINEYLSPMVIETSLKWGYFLKKDRSLPKAYIYAAVLKESSEYTLLEHLFFTPAITRPEICDQLYISETQLGRWIVKLNRYLQQFHFQIAADLHYKGDEQKIRDFFSCFLNEKYGTVEGYVDAVKIRLIDHLIEKFLKETAVFSFIHNKPDLFMGKLKFQLLTRIERIKQGYGLPKPLIVFDFSSLLISDEFYDRFYHTFDVRLTNDVLYQLFYEFFSPLTLLSASRDIQATELEQLREQIEHEIHTIEENYHIKAEHTSRLVQTIYHSLMQVSFPTYILHHKKKEFFASFMADDPELAFILKKRFSQICSILSLPESQQEEILYHGIFELLTSWRDLKKNVKNPITIVSAALFLDTTYEHMRMIKEEIESYFRNKIKIDLILPQDKLKKHPFGKYDCILSDMLIETSIPVIGIADYLNEETITKLLAFIHHKREVVQKEQQFLPFKLNAKDHQKLPLKG